MNNELDSVAETTPSAASFASVAEQLARLEHAIAERQRALQESLDLVPADRRASATNLVHYTALRQQDLRALQDQLSRLGLSSLGRCESCVLGGLLEVSARVQEALLARGSSEARAELSRLQTAREQAGSWQAAKSALHRHTAEVFGPPPSDRHISIMVTAPPAAEADRAWMVKLLKAGMNVLRINCAHESETEWAQLIDALSEARTETSLACRVVMDLAGPKIRTGPIESGRRIATWKPVRNDIGVTTAKVSVLLRRASAPEVSGGPVSLLVSDKEFAKLREGDELRLRDARGKKRSLMVEQLRYDRIVTSATERAYVLDRTEAQLHRGKKHKDDLWLVVSPTEGAIDVQSGDPLILTVRDCVGTPPTRDQDGKVETPGVVPCTLPAALAHLKVGHRVLFDDGKILCTVERIEEHAGDFQLRVAHTPKKTVQLRSEKGINLPDTLVTVAGFTEEDRRALAFVAERADAVSLSFVRTADDVRALHEELYRLDRPELGVILKIETRAGFEHLPRLLLEGLRRPPLAVMIARGDLAVEVGFERLAELQEEMLWLCEAAHVPVIWATQVLDTLARTGVPSRAEVTDAAESVAAECVMLNKGPYVHEAVSALADILQRMEKHRYKKRSLFRKLEVSSFAPRGASESDPTRGES